MTGFMRAQFYNKSIAIICGNGPQKQTIGQS